MLHKIVEGLKFMIFMVGVFALLGWALLSCNGVPGTTEYAETIETHDNYIPDNNEVWFTFDELFNK